MTFSINYTSHKIEYYLRTYLRTFIPKFHVRFAYKSMRIKQIFSKDGKPVTTKENSCFLCYKFKCTCTSSYVGRTKKRLHVRMGQHRTFSYAKKTYYHLNRCPVYVKNFENLKKFTLLPNLL
jgi:hypothetical protein